MTAPRVPNAGTAIAEYDALARSELNRIAARNRLQFTSDRDCDDQRVMTASSRAVRQSETLLQALQAIEVPFGDIAALVFQPVAVHRECSGQGLNEPLAVTVAREMKADTARRL